MAEEIENRARRDRRRSARQYHDHPKRIVDCVVTEDMPETDWRALMVGLNGRFVREQPNAGELCIPWSP